MATNYLRMANWFRTYSDEWDQLHKPTFKWPVPDSVALLVPTADIGKPYTTRGHQLVTDPLSMAFIGPAQLLAEVGSWIKQAIGIDEGMDAMRAANKELRPALMPMRADELVFTPEHDMDHCWAMALSSRMVLTRRTILREHTRVVPWHFTMPGGAKANKIYAYHAMAFAAAYIGDPRHRTPHLEALSRPGLQPGGSPVRNQGQNGHIQRAVPRVWERLLL